MNIKLGKAVETQVNMIINELLEYKKEFPELYIDFTYLNSLNNLIHTINFNVMIGTSIYDFNFNYSPTNLIQERIQVNYFAYDEDALSGIYYIYNQIKTNFENRMNLLYSEVV